MDQLQATAGAEALLTRVEALIDAGRLGAARPLLAAVCRMMPPAPRLAELGALLALREGRFDLAQIELDAAVADTPGHAGLRKSRANLRRQMGDPDGAMADASDAVILDRHDPAAKALLGVLLLERGRAGEAAICLREAVAAVPADPSYREGLAAAQEKDGDVDAALATLRAGIEAAPSRVELRNAAILLTVRQRDFTAAVTLAEDARQAGVADACTYGLQGHALSNLGQHALAGDAYAAALKLGPDDPYVRHLVAASGMLPGAVRAPVEYLRTVFDGYADRFEVHLISLGYRIPGLVRAALSAHPAIAAGQPIATVLDLGCGTGLLAMAVSDLPIGSLVGVDVSPRMLAHAAAKQLYTELIEDDLMHFLAADARRWELILATDVLCYFGELTEVFAAVHERLAPGGWFVLCTEELLRDRDGSLRGNGDWALRHQGRYAHAMAYVAGSARQAGFAVRALEQQTMRYEADAPVAAIFAVLERVRHDD